MNKTGGESDHATLNELARQFGELKTALEAENTLLRRRLAQMEGELHHLSSDPTGHARHARRADPSQLPEPLAATTERPNAEVSEIGRSLTRRDALQMFGAAAAGGVGLAIGSTLLGAEPAAAANGGTVLLGQGNAAADSTQVETTVAYGLIGSSTDKAGGGVSGIDGASATGAYGVRATSINGLGMFATLTGNGLGAIAGEDQSGQSSSYGVYGSSGSGTGVYGVSSTGSAIYGQAGGASGLIASLFHNVSGVMGDNNSGEAGVTGLAAGGTTAWGVHGVAGSKTDAITVGPAGVFGESGDPNGVGVQGSSGQSNGVIGSTTSETSAGVYGVGASYSGSGDPGVAMGVQGDSGEEGAYGVYGSCFEGTAGVGGYSRGTGLGIYGVSLGGIGGEFIGAHAPLLLGPSDTIGPPSGTGNSPHSQGEIFVDSTGSVFVCTASSTGTAPNQTAGTWRELTASAPGYNNNNAQIPGSLGQAGSINLLSQSIRVFDSRVADPPAAPKRAAGPLVPSKTYGNITQTLQITGAAVGGISVPAGAVGIIATMTAVSPSAAGFVRSYPAGGTIPTVETLFYTAGLNQVSLFFVALNSSGQIDIVVYTGATNVLIDVSGFIY